MKSTAYEREMSLLVYIFALSMSLSSKVAANDMNSYRFNVFPPHFLFSRHTSPVSAHEWTHEHQIRQPEQLSAILGQFLLSRLAVAEQVLHHVEWMFYLCPHTGFRLLQRLQCYSIRMAQRQFSDHDAPGRDLLLNLFFGGHRTLRCYGVSSITISDSFFFVQQFGSLRYVDNVSDRSDYRMYQVLDSINTYVLFYTEVLLLSCLRVMYFGITRLGVILRRGHTHDDRCIGRRLNRQIYIDKTAHRVVAINGVFNPFVRQIKSVLSHVYPQHTFESDGWVHTPPTFRIVLFDQIKQYLSWNQAIKIHQKTLAVCHLFLRRELHIHIRETDQLHSREHRVAA